MSNSLTRKTEKKSLKKREEKLAKLRDRLIYSGIKKIHQLHNKHRTYEEVKTNEDDVVSNISIPGLQNIDQIKTLLKRKKKAVAGVSKHRINRAPVRKPMKRSHKSNENSFDFGIFVKSLSTSAPKEEVKLFHDTGFADEVSGAMDGRVIWRRVRAVNSKAEFFVEFTKYPVQILHSRLGTCALSSAVQLIMHNQILFDNIVPKDQGFDKNYNGSFNFWFWKYGKWQNIVVDDFLPYEHNNLYEPVFSVLDYENTYWYSLLEKAYAKFYGSYHNLVFVTLEDALQDLTGGLVEYFMLKESGMEQDTLINSYLQNSIIALVVKELSVFKTLGQPLNCNEVYWLKDIFSADHGLFVILQKSFKVVTEAFPLIEGSDQDMASLNLYVKSEHIDVEDNKVCVSIEKIGQYFKECKIISFALTKTDKLKLLNTELKEKYWINVTRVGAWDSSNAGGNPQFSRTYWRNPQFRFKIGVIDSQSKMLCTIILGLLTSSYPTISSYSIGFSLYEVKCEDDEIWNIDLNYSNCVLIGQHELEEKRQITKRFVIPPGLYVFIPYTSLPLIQGSFIVRLFHETSAFLYLWEFNTLEGSTNQRVISTVQTYSQNVDFFWSLIKLGITVLIIGIISYMLIFKM